MNATRRRILIADDDRDALAILVAEARLIDPDADVRTASTGYRALVACNDWRPDLAVLDYQMPEMTGLQAAGILRERGIRCEVVTSSPISDEVARKTTAKDRVVALLPVWMGVEHPKSRSHARRDRTLADVMSSWWPLPGRARHA